MDQDYGPQFAEANWLGDPQVGSFSMGDGVSTQQLQNPNVSIHENTRIASGHPWSQSLGVLAVVILVLVVLEAIIRKSGEGGARMRVGVENSFLAALMVAVWFYIFKTSAPLLPVPGAVKQFVGVI